MIRILAFFAFVSAFLYISPQLRSQLLGGLATGVNSLEQHSPYSYVALGVVAIGGFIASLSRGIEPR